MIIAGDLVLRPFTAADAPRLTPALSDPDIARWAISRAITALPPSERAEAWLAGRTDVSGPDAYFAVTDGDALLGCAAVRDIGRLPQQGVISYWTTPAARGRGVASRALSALATWSFTERDVHRLNLDHVLANTASCKVAVRAGFGVEGVMRGYFIETDGQRHDAHLHSRLADD